MFDVLSRCARLTPLHHALRSWQEFRQHFFLGKDMVVSADQLPAEFALRPRGEEAPKAMLRGEALPDEVSEQKDKVTCIPRVLSGQGLNYLGCVEQRAKQFLSF